MSDPNARKSPALSRRRFVTLVAAGSAALIAGRVEAARARRVPKPAAPAASPAQKEFDRQRASTLATLKTIRGHRLPPGGELASTFRPMRATRKGR